MQIIDNLIVIHNMDEQASQIYDFKLVDYNAPILLENCAVNVKPAMRGVTISDVIWHEEKHSEEEIVKPFGKESSDTDPLLQSKEFIECNF